jgi:hypothetical protein
LKKEFHKNVCTATTAILVPSKELAAANEPKKSLRINLNPSKIGGMTYTCPEMEYRN